MTINFPTSLDTLPKPTSTTTGNQAGFEHDIVHSDVALTVEALEAKVGVDGSAVTTSLDYKITRAAKRVISFVLDGAGSALTTGYKANIQIPYAGTITAVTVLGKNGESGSVVIDLWKDTYANFPPTVADTITASAKPTISSSTKYTDATLTGWTKTIATGDVLSINVDSVSTFTWLAVHLAVTTG